MREDRISKVIGKISEHHIEEALWFEHKGQIIPQKGRTFQNAAACIAIVMLTLIGATAVVFASSEKFRNAAVKLFSGFTENDVALMEHGHMTGKLDKTDVLLTFLDAFNQNNTQGERAKNHNGYEYRFLEEKKGSITAVVTCESDKYLLVRMEQQDIEGEVKAWSVVSYQFISSGQAGELLESCPEYPDITGEDGGGAESPMDSVIKADEKYAKIYNVLHKEKIILLTEDETKALRKMLNAYEDDENPLWAAEDYNILIKTDKSTYMISENGYVVRKKLDKYKSIIFQLKENDLEEILSLLDKYGILY